MLYEVITNQVTEAVKSVKEEDKKKVYIEFSPGWTVGKGEFMDEMITLAGGTNVASDIEGWSQINEENIIKANPDVILYAKSVIENDKTLAEIIKERSGWDQITAVKNDQVIGLDDNLLSRPGPRVTQGLIEVVITSYSIHYTKLYDQRGFLGGTAAAGCRAGT